MNGGAASGGESKPPRDTIQSASTADPDSHAASPGPMPEPVPKDEYVWITPPFQPLRAIAAILLTAAGFGLYEFVLLNFWSSPAMGIHERIPWPAFGALALAMLLALAAVLVSLGIWSPHAKLGFGLLAFFACAVIGVGGGRFVSYIMRGTLNPPYHLALAVGDNFPAFALADQTGAIVRAPTPPGDRATLVFVYRGDFCPFARHELAELTALAPELGRARANVIAISADPVARSKMLAGYLRTGIPLLSDEHETILAPIGLVQRHRDGQPDNAIPAFFVIDSGGTVRWIYTSPYYRILPRTNDLMTAIRSVTKPWKKN
ncbi:MAG: peroxiredoxin family protein [Candidatus Binataceae bacterium]